jgi:flagellar biosynthesis/type III secretory pathway chaperone
MNMNQRIEDLSFINERLVDVLERENAALRKYRTEGLEELRKDKESLTRAYESRVLGVYKNIDDLSQVDEDLRERLGILGEKVDALVKENSTLLKVGIESNRRVVDMIAEAVKSINTGAQTYSGTGSMSPQNSGGGHPIGSISINETL